MEEEKKEVKEVRKIEQDGKVYLEVDYIKELKYQKGKDIVFLILILFAVVALILAIFSLVNSRDLINKDALSYGMKQHNFTGCQCTDENAEVWYSTENGFKTQAKPIMNYDPNADDVNLSKLLSN